MNDDLIIREYLLEALNDFNEHTCRSADFLRGIRTAEKIIKDAPSVCKDRTDELNDLRPKIPIPGRPIRLI